ncbi:MAG TPA: DUF2306 domain-containing protein [Dehalococcoidia bacterium]|nr:DUF2306 domain-containing protein [Dehalococcoidia bacterium]
MTLGAVLVVLMSLHYFAFNPNTYFESQRAVYEAHVVGLMLHISGMVLALALGPFQFLRSFRAKHLRLHRTTGKVYLVGATIGALGGLYMSFYSVAEVASGLGFGLLAIAVLIATTRAYLLIREGRVEEHREWMTRSFALILAAVTLRIYVPLLEIGLSEYDAFAVVAWLCWIPNLVVAQWLIRSQRVHPEPALSTTS